MEQIINYVKPELLVLAVVLYFIGAGLKQAQAVKDKYIPAILGVCGCLLAAVYVIATCPLGTMQEIAHGSIYSYRTGDSCSWVKYICQSACEAG